jgi:hypothetical protein
MKMYFHIVLFIGTSVFLVMLLAMPQEGLAQRFNHPNYGGGGNRGPSPSQNNSRPASPPAAYHPAPSVNRPAAPVENRQPTPSVNRPPQQNQQSESRPTINGGSYNAGNHNYNYSQNAVTNRVPEKAHENVPVNTRPNVPVNVHQNVTVQRNVTVHENVNVYHNHYQPPHAYAYHPYHPYYWGHNWHPVGYFAATLATDAFLLSIANQQYYYDEGVYYRPSSGGYSVVPAPIGAIVSSLPPGYETTMVGNDDYFYYGGTFYIDTGNGYQVVAAPFGAVITQIPDGAVQQDINGETYLVYNNTYYQPVSEDGQDAYEVVQVN